MADTDAAANPFSTLQGAGEAVAEVLDTILTNGGNILYDHYLEDRETAYATSRVVGDLRQVRGQGLLGGGLQCCVFGTRCLRLYLKSFSGATVLCLSFYRFISVSVCRFLSPPFVVLSLFLSLPFSVCA